MPGASSLVLWQQPLDGTAYAAASFLSRYRGATLRAYTQDLRAFLAWCTERDLTPLQAQRPHLELYLRWMERQDYAPATISRRFTTVAGFYRYATSDGHCPKDPALAVTRPRVAWEGQRRSVLHPLEYAALLTAARQDSLTAHALIALLGMLGLRVSEAVHADVTDLRTQSGYELLYILGKGAKHPGQGGQARADPAARAGAAGRPRRHRRTHRWTAPAQPARRPPQPVLGRRPSAPTGQRHRSARAAQPTHLRRTFCAAGLVSGVPLREMQYPCATPTPAPRCATTWPEPTSTGTPPTRSPPTSPA